MGAAGQPDNHQTGAGDLGGGEPGNGATQVAALLTAIEACGRVVWDAETSTYRPCLPEGADRYARADAESVAILMTTLRQWYDGAAAD